MNRINLLASLCKGSNIVCDIGCDHAYVLIEAIKSYNVKKGIASDIGVGPLEMAKKSINEGMLNDKIELCLSNGFENVDSKFDTAIIAGMGGSLIIDILSNGLSKLGDSKLILQPNNDRFKLRVFLKNNNYKIIDEYAFVDSNKYYEIIVAIPCQAEYDFYDLKYGPILRNNMNSDYINHYRKELLHLESIVGNIKNNQQILDKKIEISQLKYLLGDVNMEKINILNTDNYYTTHFIDDTKRPTIVVSPGGGYKYTSPRESQPVVNVFNSLGYHVVVVHYRQTIEDAYPKTAIYLAEAIKAVRADERCSKLIGLGFSAGGHNMLEVSIRANNYGDNVKPDLLMLGYPVVTSDNRYWHQGSFEYLLKDKFNNKDALDFVSLEKHIPLDAPDLFLWGTYTDESVDVMNSLLLIQAYKEKNLNVEYHMFPMGGHGLSVCNMESAEGNLAKVNPYIARWVNLADEWIKEKIK